MNKIQQIEKIVREKCPHLMELSLNPDLLTKENNHESTK